MGGVREPIRAARTALGADPRGHLPRPVRDTLLRALGPYESGGADPPTAGHRVRGRVAIACVRAVLPAWAELFPNDDMPERTLAAAEARLRGKIEVPAAVEARHRVMQHADRVEAELWDRTHDSTDMRVLVCKAAHQALCVALWDEWLGGEEGFPVDAEDNQLDRCDYETAYLASVVAANGFLKQRAADTGRRREFWSRYLGEIIPGAVAAESAEPHYGLIRMNQDDTSGRVSGDDGAS
jgi:Immunity protein Imm5